MSSSVVSGRRRRRRIDRGELRWPATGTAMVAALQHVREVRSSTRRWRGLWRSSEAGRGGEGRPVATAMPVGGGGGSRVRGRESRGRRGGRGRVRAVRGSCVASSGASRAREGSRRWPAGGEVARARAGERRAHAVPLSGEDDRGGVQAGWAASWLGRPAAAGLRRGGEAQVSPPSFLFLFF